jgi:hypothetical protein
VTGPGQNSGSYNIEFACDEYQAIQVRLNVTAVR